MSVMLSRVEAISSPGTTRRDEGQLTSALPCRGMDFVLFVGHGLKILGGFLKGLGQELAKGLLFNVFFSLALGHLKSFRQVQAAVSDAVASGGADPWPMFVGRLSGKRPSPIRPITGPHCAATGQLQPQSRQKIGGARQS